MRWPSFSAQTLDGLSTWSIGWFGPGPQLRIDFVQCLRRGLGLGEAKDLLDATTEGTLRALRCERADREAVVSIARELTATGAEVRLLDGDFTTKTGETARQVASISRRVATLLDSGLGRTALAEAARSIASELRPPDDVSPNHG